MTATVHNIQERIRRKHMSSVPYWQDQGYLSLCALIAALIYQAG